MNNVKVYLDDMVEKYNTKSFINQDPILFPRLFSERKDIEIVSFLASTIAWGNRKQILKDCEKMFFDIMDKKPYDYIMAGDYSNVPINYNIHRTFFGKDFVYMCNGLKHVYDYYESLEEMFENTSVWNGFSNIKKVFLSSNGNMETRHISNPYNSSCKRLNMMLRWLCRQDGIVDIGIWKNIDPSSLMIPVDVHVFRIGTELGLIKRKTNDRKTVEELTSNLGVFCTNDPCKYDFALFGIGESRKRKTKKELKLNGTIID